MFVDKKESLPSSLLDVYVRYKTGTRAIIQWLVSNGARGTSNSGSREGVSIRELKEFAHVIVGKAITMPDVIAFQFRETIEARSYLSRFFRESIDVTLQNKDVTSSHEYFTSSLRDIYASLDQSNEKPTKIQQNKVLRQDPSLARTENVNRFEALEDHDMRWPAPGEGNSRQKNQVKKSESKSVWCDSFTRFNPRLIGDELGEALHLLKEMQDLNDLILTVKDSWTQAAREEIPIVVATSITNAAMALFEGIEIRLRLCLCRTDPDVLHARCVQIQQLLSAIRCSRTDKVLYDPTILEPLQDIWKLLQLFKQTQAMEIERVPSCCLQRPVECIPDAISTTPQMKNDCFTMILKSIQNLTQSEASSSLMIRRGTPIYADVGCFLKHDNDNKTGLRCTFGLRILFETFQSYLWPSADIATKKNCRIEVLQLAREARLGVRAVLGDSSMPCRCHGTLAYHLAIFGAELQKFVEEKFFDLYFQAPWVAGSHMIEVLDATYYYGMRLLSYKNYVGSLLHVYNMIRKLTELEPIPLLEELSTTCQDVIFLGEQPWRNFSACYTRFMGGRLRFHSKGNSNSHRNSWHMIIPEHTAKAAAGFGTRKDMNNSRFEYRSFSLFHHIYTKQYHLSEKFWSEIRNDRQTRSKLLKKRKCLSFSQGEHPITIQSSAENIHDLKHLQHHILKDFTGKLPIARINFFAVYLACVEVISIISDSSHGDNYQGKKCICFVNTILATADSYQLNEHKNLPFNCRGLLETCRSAMQAVLQEKPLEAFLWTF